MSKMSQLHAELTEKACELGYSSLENAMADGYVVDYENVTLVDGREQAHEDYLKRKEKILGELISVYNDIDVPKDYKTYLKHAIDFIKEGEI